MKSIIGTLLTLSALSFAACDSSDQPHPSALPANQAVASTRQIMLGITAPTADVIFQIGMQDPTTAVDWEKVEASAVSLSESARLLMVPPRLVDRQQWLQDCNDLIAAAGLAAAAAKNKSADGVMQAAGPIYEACAACHQKYAPTLSAK